MNKSSRQHLRQGQQHLHKTTSLLAVILLTAAHTLAQHPQIVFANILTAPTNELPREALYPPGFHSTNYGPFSNIISNGIASLRVTWADPAWFPSQETASEFLRETMGSTNSQTAAFHVWSYGDGDPTLTAVIEHRKGQTGEFRVWCRPNICWAYHDGNGKWWWTWWDQTAVGANGTMAKIIASATNPPPVGETLRTAINQQDWPKLRTLARSGMRANDYITQWESSARAGNPVEIGRPLRVEKSPDKESVGSTRTVYVYEEWQDGHRTPHEFQVIVNQTANGAPTLADFWTFGW